MLTTMIELLALIISVPGASSFITPSNVRRFLFRPAIHMPIATIHPAGNSFARIRMLATRGGEVLKTEAPDSASSTDNEGDLSGQFAWSPQDLTRDSPGFMPIPADDYVKKYQTNPELWPVEFFLLVYRRTINTKTKKTETQVLVRRSANGTSKWGVGSGVPATRWMLSTQKRPPLGYKRSDPPINFDASNFPEFSTKSDERWSYDKIDIRGDAFNGPGAAECKDRELEEYASEIRHLLIARMSEMAKGRGKGEGAWEANRNAVIKNLAEKSSSLAAIQGTLRMSGVFARREACVDGLPGPRFVSLGEGRPDPAGIAQSMRIFTMFPQMPDPLPLPSTPSEELQKEIASRATRMAKINRDPHKDKYGRKFTHKSTSNVSNTIHGIYLTLDATDLPGLVGVPALDLFGHERTKREWKSLEDLKVLGSDGNCISTEDTKPVFISGLIIRQLVKEGIINTNK